MADPKNLETILAKFGFVTVLEPTFYTVGDESGGAGLFTIDSLRISNITQEGPTKSAKGGLYAETQMRYGKTMRIEMEDVVGRIDVLTNLMGAELIGATGSVTGVQITDKFAVSVRLEGKTFVIDQNGDKQWVKIIIPEFLPDSIFEMTMEAEGDFGAMNIGGEIIPTECGLFYKIVDMENVGC